MNRPAQHAFEPEEIMAYFDGELEPRRAAALAAHLDLCAECQSIAAGLRRVSDQLAAWDVGPSPAVLADKVAKAVQEQGGSKSLEGKQEFPRMLRLREWFQARPWAWGIAGAVGVAVLWMMTGTRSAMLRPRGIPSQKTAKYQAWLERDAAHSTPTTPEAGIVGGSVAQHQEAALPPSSVATSRRGRSRSTESLAANSLELRDKAELSDSSDERAIAGQRSPVAQSPMIARTAALSIVVKDFGPVEAAVKGITGRHHGYVGELSTTAPKDAARNLDATLRIPSPQLDAALAELKQLGRLEQESQSGEEVTKEYTDLAARLKNSRTTEQRLVEVLRNNTGKVKDILEVEQEIARVRGEIEQMEADQRTLKTRVDYAILRLSVAEDFRASLQVAPPSTATRLHNAVVEGYHDVAESLIGFAVWLLAVGPTLLIWGSLLFFPARWAWKRWHRREQVNTSSTGAA